MTTAIRLLWSSGGGCLGNPLQASNLGRCEDSPRTSYRRRVT